MLVSEIVIKNLTHKKIVICCNNCFKNIIFPFFFCVNYMFCMVFNLIFFNLINLFNCILYMHNFEILINYIIKIVDSKDKI